MIFHLRVVKILIFLLLVGCPVKALSCQKELLVDIINKKSLPSMWDLSQKEYVKKNQIIKISCELYKTISEGDTLVPKDDEEIELNLRDALFGSPVEQVRYKVIRKL